jgi:hypothetical protein
MRESRTVAGSPFARVKYGLFAGSGVPGTLRYSSALRELRKQGAEDTAKELERVKTVAGSSCPTHGELADPIIGILDNRVAFICPWCSGAAILAAWEAEGNRS